VIGGFDDFFAGEIQHAAIERLQADADLLLGDGGGHGEESEGAGAWWTGPQQAKILMGLESS
jgi:hypothetical protein